MHVVHTLDDYCVVCMRDWTMCEWIMSL